MTEDEDICYVIDINPGAKGVYGMTLEESLLVTSWLKLRQKIGPPLTYMPPPITQISKKASMEILERLSGEYQNRPVVTFCYDENFGKNGRVWVNYGKELEPR